MPDSKWSKKLSSVMFNTATDTSDFGGFGDEPERAPAPEGGNKKGGFGGFKLDKKAIIIAAAAAVAVVALVIVLAVALFSGNGNIEYENNAYMTYVDGQDKYHVIANGEVVEHVFEGEVDLIPSADNSFAYVFDHGDDGVYMYLLEGKKLKPILDTAVEGYIATAGIEPGIVFTESGSSGMKYMLYNQKKGIREITKEKKDPQDFIISGDGLTVVYTTADDDSSDRVLQMYDNGKWDKVTSTSCTPIAISNYGDYIYVARDIEGVRKLYAIDLTTKDRKTYPVKNSENFLYILEMNVKGDEVIYCTGEGPDSFTDILDGDFLEVKSFLYRHKAKTDDESVIALGDNFVTSAENSAPEVAVYKTFAGAYLETDVYEDLEGKEYTYHLTKKFEKETIQKYSGKFSSDGKYFYYTNDHDDLIRLDLSDDARPTERILEDVKDFYITKKGNVYVLDADNYLWFYKSSNGDQDRISSEANKASIYLGSNKVYFAENESEVIYLSEEGNEKDIAKFGTSELKAVPYFSTQVGKKCYAVAYDETAESYAIYYTSNGNRFSIIKDAADCEEVIYGVEIPEDYEW